MNENEQTVLEGRVKEIIDKSMRASPGMIKTKELSERVFLNKLFEVFDIESSESDSIMQTRMKVQKLLQQNLRESIGMYHAKELNESTFTRELILKFKLTLRHHD